MTDRDTASKATMCTERARQLENYEEDRGVGVGDKEMDWQYRKVT